MEELIFDLANIDTNLYFKIKKILFDNTIEKIKDNEEVINLLGNKKYQKLIEAIDNIDSFKLELEEKNIKYITINSEEYPLKLKNISSPPLIIYYIGNINLINEFSLAVIGSRKPSVYGMYVANKISKEISHENITVISGLAEGIDGIAHESAVKESQKTIAVMGTSVDKIYPKTNTKLYHEIIKNNGLIISENHHRKTVKPYMFMARNRIISALSDGIVVIEASLKSGTMTTVEFALEQGRTVFAVPGNINSNQSKGTNKLIKNGAVMVTEIEDILNEFSILPQSNNEVNNNAKEKNNLDLSDKEKQIYDYLKEYGCSHVEVISVKTKLPIRDVSGILNILELKDIVTELGNKLYILK